MNLPRMVVASRRWLIVSGVIAGIALGLTIYGHHLLGDPRVVWLTAQEGADWLRADVPFDLKPHSSRPVSAEFRGMLLIPRDWNGGDLKITALRRARISIDGHPIFDTGPDLDGWKTTRAVALPRHLTEGTHQLSVLANDVNGPAMIRLSCQWLRKDSWQARADQAGWHAPVAASAPFEPEIQKHFPSVGAAFAQCWPMLICLAGLATFGAIKAPMKLSATWGSRGRWIILLMWLAMALRARVALPDIIGYDSASHLRYINYVAENRRLPAPDAGWEFFQAPLYYIVSAGLMLLVRLAGVSSESDLIHWLRLIPLASGILLTEVSYRTARTVFPVRGDLQLIATILAGFVPMNLYMAQLLSNEPLAALFAAIGVLMMMQLIVQPEKRTHSRLIMLGLVSALACLTKVTSLLWLLPIEIAVLIALRRNHRNWPAAMGSLAIVPLVAVLSSSWYFAHNLRSTGKWIITNSIADWWQDPGYRTPAMFLEFGHVLCGPAYTTVRSVWDSLYGTLWADGMLSGIVLFPAAPPYNYLLMACGMWLGLLPMVLIFLGAARPLVRYIIPEAGTPAFDTAPLLLAALSILVFTATILHQYLMIPLYGWGKASYMLGATPCLALLGAAGFDLFSRSRMLRAATSALLFTWAITAYLTFWII